MLASLLGLETLTVQNGVAHGGLPEYLDDRVGHEEVEDDWLGLHPRLAVDEGEQPDVPAGHLDKGAGQMVTNTKTR